jgi:hypothetical protein
VIEDLRCGYLSLEEAVRDYGFDPEAEEAAD